jgi:hypothetical protein
VNVGDRELTVPIDWMLLLKNRYVRPTGYEHEKEFEVVAGVADTISG